MHDELGAHDAVRLGVAAALEAARLPQPRHLRAERLDDRVDELLLPGQQALLGEPEVLPHAAAIDQRGDQAGNGVAQRRVERRPHPGVEAPLEVQEFERQVRQQVEERRTGVGRRHRSTGVGVHGGSSQRTPDRKRSARIPGRKK